jgi:hypothetical protein
VGLEELLAGLGVEGEALEESDDETDAVGTGEFEVGRGRQLRVDLDYFLEEDGDGAYGVPQQDGQVGVGLALAAEQVQRLSGQSTTSSRFSGSFRFLM